MRGFEKLVFRTTTLKNKYQKCKASYKSLIAAFLLGIVYLSVVGFNNTIQPTTLYIKESNFGPQKLPGTDIALMKDSNQKNTAIVLVSGRHDGGQTYICPWNQTSHTFDSAKSPCQPIGTTSM